MEHFGVSALSSFMNCCLFSDVLSFNFTLGSNYLLYAQDNILSCAQTQRKTKVEVRLKWKHVYMNLFVWGLEGVGGGGGLGEEDL